MLNNKKSPIPIGAEELAGWYFRLNGFLTIPNFIVHEDAGIGQRTEVDVFGVRYPHRSELRLDPMEDHAVITDLTTTKPILIIAEVKGNKTCNLNGPWVEPERENMHRVLSAIGLIPPSIVAAAASTLYSKGFWENEQWYVTLMCIGLKRNREWAKKFPQMPQVLWPEILDFIYQRFKRYSVQKRSNSQWDHVGRCLFGLVELACDSEGFRKLIKIVERSNA
jgi:hypothetical protein